MSQEQRLKPCSYVVTIGHRSGSRSNPMYKFPYVTVEINTKNKNFITSEVKGDEFFIFIGEKLRSQGSLARSLTDSSGMLLVYNNKTKELKIESDRLGSVIAYWAQSADGTFTISNRLDNIASSQSPENWSAIQRYLHTGYTVGSSTFFSNIRQTLPNSVMTIHCSDNPRISAAQNPAGGIDPNTSTSDLIEQIGNQIIKSKNNCADSILMTSAGWDSRTLLIGDCENIKGAYTHGDLSSREIRLAQSLSGSLRLDHLFVDVTSSDFSSSTVDKMLYELGFAVFPIWHAAANNVENWRSYPLMNGLFGELIGGHFGIMSLGTQTQRMASSILLLSDKLFSKKQLDQRIDYFCTPPTSHWFVSDAGQKILDQNRNETREVAKNHLNNIYSQTHNWQKAIEYYNIEHKQRQYMFKQNLCSAASVGYTAPYANPHLVDLCLALNFEERIHNKASKKILEKHGKALLELPMAATLIAAKYPVLMQELSRGVRIIGEKTLKIFSKKAPALGWFNYSHLHSTNELNTLIDSLKHEMWDKNKMHQTLLKNHDAGHTLDMICKIKTVDYYLSLE